MKQAKIQQYVEEAQNAFNSGFSSKSSKSKVNSNLNRAYGWVVESIQNKVLEVSKEERTEEQDSVYWDLPPTLSNWKEKHTKLVMSVFPEEVQNVKMIEEMKELFTAIKNIEVVKVEKVVNEKEVEVQKTVKEIIESMNQSYVDGLELSKLFGGLSVYANVHLVTNQHGTTFTRAFYYLHGKLTPLNVIITISEQMGSDVEKNYYI